MAQGINKVTLFGNVGRDPELKSTMNGTSVTTLSVATNESWTDKDGERRERTEWHRVVVWGKNAEACKQCLVKGSKVLVEGRLQTRKWTDSNGTDKYTTEIVANYVHFLSPHKQNEQDTDVVGYNSPADDQVPFALLLSLYGALFGMASWMFT